MNIEWAKEAAQQLLSVHDYVVQDVPRAAGRILARIMQAVKNLASYPRAGRPGRVKNTRELVILNTSFIVAYRIKKEVSIQILAVLHGRRRWPRNF